MNSHKGSKKTEDSLKHAFTEFCVAWIAGDKPDLDEFCGRHPSCETSLRAYIDDFLSVDHFTAKHRNIDISATAEKQSVGSEQCLEDFQLLREVGRGGMGVVYKALQTSLNRIVALKVLPAHLTLRKETILRFKREASTAAKLKHPGIVKIHAVGEVEGNHFFAMDLIDGTPLDRVISQLSSDGVSALTGSHLGNAVRRETHCREPSSCQETNPDLSGVRLHDFWNRTYVDAVCRIMVQVTDALDYAHKAGVIHRDIKPSNIILKEDGRIVLTDFGLAREQGLSSLTVTGELAGTPDYTAPEQLSLKRVPTDHRADIFSLGVTLYELLTLVRPFEGETFHDVLGKISSKEPTSPRLINPAISKDIETICKTAMDKNPSRRYQSAAEFGEDLQNFIEYRPIAARPVGIATRTFRLIRRNPANSVMIGLLFLLIIVGPLVFGIQHMISNNEIRKVLKEVEEERDAKEIALNEKASALQYAENEAATSKQVSDYLISIFNAANPFITKGAEVSAHDLLQRGAAKISTELADQPIVHARLMHAIGTAYHSLGFYDNAEIHLKKAGDIFRSELGDDHTSTINSDFELARVYLTQHRLDEASHLLAKAKRICRFADGQESPLMLRIETGLGRLLQLEARFEEAQRAFQNTIDGYRRLFGDDDPRLIEPMHQLANIYGSQGNYREAENLLISCLNRSRRTLGDDNFTTILLTNDLGSLYLMHGSLQNAEPLLLSALEGHRLILGDGHYFTYIPMFNIATLYHRRGRLKEAEVNFVRSLNGFRETVGSSHIYALNSGISLAQLYLEQGRYNESEALLLNCLENSRRSVNSNNLTSGNPSPGIDPLNMATAVIPRAGNLQVPFSSGVNHSVSQRMISRILSGLSHLYMLQNKHIEAETLWHEALEIDCESLGEDHPMVLLFMIRLGMIYLQSGRYDLAETQMTRSLNKCRLALGDQHAYTRSIMTDLARLHLQSGRFTEATTLLIEGLKHRHPSDSNQRPVTFSFEEDLCLPFNHNSEYLEVGIPPPTTEYPAGGSHLRVSNTITDNILGHLSDIYSLQGIGNQAELIHLKVIEEDCNFLGEDHPGTLYRMIRLGCFYLQSHRFEKAETQLCECLTDCRDLLGDEHPYTLHIISDLAKIYWERGHLNKDTEATVKDIIDKIPQSKNADSRHLLLLLMTLNCEMVRQQVKLITTNDDTSNDRLMLECDETYKHLNRFVGVEPNINDYLINLCLTDNLEQYNRLGDAIGNERSSAYPVYFVPRFLGAEPVSVTYNVGNKPSQLRFTEGLVRHAVAEQYLVRINGTGEIPDWFIKGQAAKIERYFHPEYIKWSVREELIPLGGFIELENLFESFGYTAHEIHMAGLVCAYLESDGVSDEVKASFADALFAISRGENIVDSFDALEKALVEVEEKLRAFLESHAGE